MNIGLFGGTFDPIHNAHLLLALGFAQELKLDKLLLIPAAVPYHRQQQPIASAKQRLEMLELVTNKHPKLELEDCEIGQTKPSYSVETLRLIRNKFGKSAKLWWLIGADAFLRLDSWWHWQELTSLVNIAVAARPGSELILAPAAKAWRTWKSAALDSQSCGAIVFLNLPLFDVSSSEIRQRLASGLCVDKLVPSEVLGYITQHNLYQKNR